MCAPHPETPTTLVRRIRILLEAEAGPEAAEEAAEQVRLAFVRGHAATRAVAALIDGVIPALQQLERADRPKASNQQLRNANQSARRLLRAAGSRARRLMEEA